MEQRRGSEPICNIVFLGPVSQSSREQLVKGLQQRFKLTTQQAESLLQKAPVIVKRGLSLEKAHSFVHHLEEIGAKVRIERIVPEEHPEAPLRPEIAAQERVPPHTDEAPRASYSFWEDMENLGFFKAFFGTLGEVLFHPSRFYSRMPVEGGLIRPLIFAIIMGVVGGLLGLVYQFLTMSFFGSMFESQAFGNFSVPFSVPMMIGSAIGLPILTIIGVFIGSGVLHVCLMIVRGNRKGFEATFRVIAYAMSTQIFAIIPFLGGAIGAIWALVIEIIGIRESHGISTGRAALAILLPILVIVVLLAVLAAVMIPIIFRVLSEVTGNF